MLNIPPVFWAGGEGLCSGAIGGVQSAVGFGRGMWIATGSETCCFGNIFPIYGKVPNHKPDNSGNDGIFMDILLGIS